MSKETLLDLIQELIRIKIHYYRTLGMEEIIIDLVVNDVYCDLTELLEEEMDTHLPNITEYELLEMVIGGVQ